MANLINRLNIAAAVTCTAIFSATSLIAQDTIKRPVLSDPYTVENVVSAIAEATMRSKTADTEQLARFSQHEGAWDTFTRTDSILQQVSWPYGDCTDLTSLIPPPDDGWGLRSETLIVSLSAPKISDERAEVSFTYLDPSPELIGDDVFKTSQTVTITITSNPAASAAIKQSLANPALRDAMFTPGPYGYPVLPFSNAALLGDYTVDVVGTGMEHPSRYFAKIVKCAIDNGLIAEGVDPAELTEEP